MTIKLDNAHCCCWWFSYSSRHDDVNYWAASCSAHERDCTKVWWPEEARSLCCWHSRFDIAMTAVLGSIAAAGYHFTTFLPCPNKQIRLSVISDILELNDWHHQNARWHLLVGHRPASVYHDFVNNYRRRRRNWCCRAKLLSWHKVVTTTTTRTRQIQPAVTGWARTKLSLS